ncbi:choline/Carnitine o-acyltransferase [Secundilactobacillus pentosiphilus]|uniref:Choline/Carnitine o-acyltransferase n=1 Tax=Secundilactobacillus pentosiphilus TaxID=1714682 RepID=A0A1Z5IVA5_9LACO|nr:choline/carnitine O-acyltransferase [Secundilactobacillus pentosiphilus]GAX05695.1 choline/Carnitine o-acyltransferase [Secundilactobacillus pentosiphilus]
MTEKYSTDLLTQLPKLSLPSLEETLKRIVEWCTPIVGAAEQKKLAALIADFQKSDAPELQSLLKQQWVETNASWLTPILRHHYLINRKPLQCTSNFALTVSPAQLPNLDQITMAAKLLQNFADQYLAYASGDAPLETGLNGQPLDMSTYQRLFRTQRQPGCQHDLLQKTRQTLTNVEATVIYRQTFYQVRLIDHAGRVSTLRSLTEALIAIIQNTATDPVFTGAYTGLPRTTAAKLRQQLTTNKLNRDNLTRISNSLLVLTLQDSDKPLTAQSALLGSQDRFFDKTVQVFVSANTNIGFAFEHSQIDTAQALRLTDSVVAHLSQPADQWDSKGKPHFQQLEWQLDLDTKTALSEASRQNAQIANQLTSATTTISDLGTAQLEELTINPDAFIQIGLALAEYRATGGWQNITQTVSLRHFYQGRTDEMPTVSFEMKRFIQAFGDGQRDVTVRQLFDHAVSAYNERIGLGQTGMGIVRHLLGMHDMMRQNGGEAAFPEAAAFFNSPFLNQLVTPLFSTASIPMSIVDSFLTAPRSSDGYGIYYSVSTSKIRLTVSSWITNTFDAHEILTDITDSLTELFNWVAEND